MSLRPSELAQIALELRSLLGAPVQKAHSPLPRLAYLELRAPGRSVLLCLSAEPEVSRLSVAPKRPPSPEQQLPFQRSLRQHLLGARLEAIEHRPSERLVALRFGKEGKRFDLIGELFSPGLLVLASEGGRILAVSGEPRGPRSARPGGGYVPPPEGERRELPCRLVPPEGAAFPFAEAAEALFAPRAADRRGEELRRALLAPLKARLSRAERTLEKVRAEAGRTADAEEHRRVGELLAQNLHLLRRGEALVKLTEYTGEGPVEREVRLDPKLSPKEEVERHFHQYRRLLRGVEHARRRLAELEDEASALRREIQQLESRSQEQLLSDFVPLRPAARRAGPPEAVPYKEYRSATGARIWVGKGPEENDSLTFRIARPDDLWLHARGWPGSHVVVPLERRAELPQELLLDAAHLALHHSGAKGESRGEVAYTKVKHVRKDKGGPGRVTYSREKTVQLRVQPDRLERLLKSKAP